MRGMYASGKGLPRVVHISIARYHRKLPRKGETLEFLVSIHEEGQGVTWQQNVRMDPEAERSILDMTHDLYLWSRNAALRPKDAYDRVDQLGKRLYAEFIGRQGDKILDTISPTAILLNVDETILNLPWELIRAGGEALSQKIPFGRLVTTRTMPRPPRDPLKEDDTIRILAVANPTLDLVAGEREVKALHQLAGDRAGYRIVVEELTRDMATSTAFRNMLEDGDFDVIHFSGHGSFDPLAPETSTIRFADGVLIADDILDLRWDAPPYLVFNSACESGRAAGGKRLVSSRAHSNGLASAFITAGTSAYAGFYWPVTDVGAALFTRTFYEALFLRENVGLAFLEARNRVQNELGEVGDLTGYSAVLFGDAASEHRKDLYMMA